ncbi:hypothetical protein MOV61_22150, partial [Neorhizobium sp. BETTINA12A]|nr:hypothetical protein [Neorhizobium sp. BETTINA12A]
EDGSGKAGAIAPGTALGKPADKLGEDAQSGTADAKAKDADGALEPQAIAACLKSLPPVSNKIPGPCGPGEAPTSFVMKIVAPAKQ